MSVPDFRKGQILLCRWGDGDTDLCVFQKRTSASGFECTNFSRFNPLGNLDYQSDRGATSYGEYNDHRKNIQFQLATLEQIKQYGYEKHLDLWLQFPEFYPEPQPKFQPEKEAIDEAIALLKARGYRISKKSEQWIEV